MSSHSYRLTVAGHSITVTRKPIKSLRLRVHADGARLSVSAPHGLPEDRIIAFVASRSDWIARQQALLGEASPPRRRQRQWLTGERVAWLGRSLPLVVEEAPAPARALPPTDTLRLRLPAGAGAEARGRLVRAAYEQALRGLISERAALWQQRVGRRASHIGIRNMRSRWGSCTPASGRIRINLRVMALPVSCLDYVLAHELTHLRVAGHGAAFWQALEAAMPAWRAPHALLRGTRLDERDWQFSQ